MKNYYKHKTSVSICCRWSAMSIHGDKTQLEQDHVLQGMFQKHLCSFYFFLDTRYVFVPVFWNSAVKILFIELAVLRFTVFMFHCQQHWNCKWKWTTTARFYIPTIHIHSIIYAAMYETECYAIVDNTPAVLYKSLVWILDRWPLY